MNVYACFSSTYILHNKNKICFFLISKCQGSNLFNTDVVLYNGEMTYNITDDIKKMG